MRKLLSQKGNLSILGDFLRLWRKAGKHTAAAQTTTRFGGALYTSNTRVYRVYTQPVKSGDLIKLLERAGWFRVAVRGSHHQFKHPVVSGRVTVPHPKKDLPVGTAAAILKQAGLK